MTVSSKQEVLPLGCAEFDLLCEAAWGWVLGLIQPTQQQLEGESPPSGLWVV